MADWQRLKQIYQTILDKDPSNREAFLNEVCAGDENLRREVESLLAHEENAARFMNEPAVEMAARTFNDNLRTSLVGRTLNHYDVLSLLGAEQAAWVKCI